MRKCPPAITRREAYQTLPKVAGEGDRQVRLPSGFVDGAFTTFPADMHEVQTFTRRLSPEGSWILKDCRLGSHRRFDLLFAWLTVFPVLGPLPHT